MYFPMPPLDRYFSEQAISGDRLSLSGPEAHHLIHVMRGKPGTQLIVFDGRGGEWLAEIDSIQRGRVELSILRREAIERELSFTLTVASPLPKGDRQRWLVEKLVELGVTRLVPLRTTRSIVQPDEHAVSRLERHVIEASKQCGRNRLMEIAAPIPWPDFVSQTQTVPARFVAHPSDQGVHHGSSASGFGSFAISEGEAVAVGVGPEGGFTEQEVALAAAAGWTVVDLGPRILRIETAALVMATLAIDHFQATPPCP